MIIWETPTDQIVARKGARSTRSGIFFSKNTLHPNVDNAYKIFIGWINYITILHCVNIYSLTFVFLVRFDANSRFSGDHNLTKFH